MATRKNIFNARYQGPRGRHLSCLTETTQFGDYTEGHQKSIHPTGRHKLLHLRADGKTPICGKKSG